MREMSEKRRRVAVMAASLGSMSGVGPILLRHHHRLQFAWMLLFAALMVWVIVLLARLRRDERCL